MAGRSSTPDFEAVEPGLRRIYRRGRRTFRAARKDPTAETLHEWRKRVKDLWYAAQILRPASPRRMKALASTAHDVSNLLGEDHDLAVLAAEARRGRAELGDEATLIGLEGLIERRRAALQRRALTAGADLYARKPRQFVGRIERRWNKRVGSATPASA
jgi:CHAD domain-containing protein